MKQLKIWSMMMLAAMMITIMVSCGDDTSGGKSSQTMLVDGVNVNKRKLLTLELLYMGSSTGICQMTYDSKGRLTEIDIPNVGTGLRIDYDLRMIEYYDGYKYTYDYQEGRNVWGPNYVKCRFTLNERGFISQFGNCECTYNSEGYLTEVKSITDWLTLAYSNEDIVKAMVEKLKSGNIDLYYVYYEDKTNEGELYITCKELEASFNEKVERSIMAMIAYHAGLFGNITKHCTMLPNTSDAKTFVELSKHSWSGTNKSEPITYACKFTFSN